MSDSTSPLAPLDPFPERVTNIYEAKMAPNAPGGRGPLHPEEGIATDTDVPNDFVEGISSGYRTGSRPNQNAVVWLKDAAETQKERAHVGSAAWVEAPTYLGAFAGGTGPEAERKFIQVDVGDTRKERHNAATVLD
jgi:hypothetical protein